MFEEKGTYISKIHQQIDKVIISLRITTRNFSRYLDILQSFFFLSDLNSNYVSSLKILLISTFISRVHPGKMQHILSALLLLKEESTVEQALFFVFSFFDLMMNR